MPSHDMIRLRCAPVTTVGTGCVAAPANSHLPGRARAPPLRCPTRASISTSPPVLAQASDIAIQAMRDHPQCASASPRSPARPAPAVDRAHRHYRARLWMSADEAISYGPVSRVVGEAVRSLDQNSDPHTRVSTPAPQRCPPRCREPASRDAVSLGRPAARRARWRSSCPPWCRLITAHIGVARAASATVAICGSLSPSRPGRRRSPC